MVEIFHFARSKIPVSHNDYHQNETLFLLQKRSCCMRDYFRLPSLSKMCQRDKRWWCPQNEKQVGKQATVLSAIQKSWPERFMKNSSTTTTLFGVPPLSLSLFCERHITLSGQLFRAFFIIIRVYREQTIMRLFSTEFLRWNTNYLDSFEQKIH